MLFALFASLLSVIVAPAGQTPQIRSGTNPISVPAMLVQPAHPNVKQNGSSFVVLRFPHPLSSAYGPFASTPDDAVYFVEKHLTIGRMSLDGVFREIQVAETGPSLFYFNSSFYMSHTLDGGTPLDGMTRYSSDFLHRQYFQSRARINSFASGSDGNVYASAQYEPNPGSFLGEIVRYDRAGTQTFYPIPALPSNLVTANDGKLYFAFYGQCTPECGTGIGRLENNGSVTLFPVKDPCYLPDSLTAANGALYFNCDLKNVFGRMELNGAFSYFPYPKDTVLLVKRCVQGIKGASGFENAVGKGEELAHRGSNDSHLGFSADA